MLRRRRPVVHTAMAHSLEIYSIRRVLYYKLFPGLGLATRYFITTIQILQLLVMTWIEWYVISVACFFTVPGARVLYKQIIINARIKFPLFRRLGISVTVLLFSVCPKINFFLLCTLYKPAWFSIYLFFFLCFISSVLCDEFVKLLNAYTFSTCEFYMK